MDETNDNRMRNHCWRPAALFVCRMSGCLGRSSTTSSRARDSQQPYSSATAIPTTRPTPTSLPTPTATPPPTLTPSPTPTHWSTPTTVAQVQPTPKPTPKPTPTPACKAVNNNTWCYNFDSAGGKLITNPPSNFCDFFPCIATFVSSDGLMEGMSCSALMAISVNPVVRVAPVRFIAVN